MTDFSDLTRELEEEFSEFDGLPIGSNATAGEDAEQIERFDDFDESSAPKTRPIAAAETEDAADPEPEIPDLSSVETADENAAPYEEGGPASEPEQTAGPVPEEPEETTGAEPETEHETEPETETSAPPRKSFFAALRERAGQKDRLFSNELDILIALLPLVVWGVYAYGTRVLAVVLTGVCSAMAADVIGIAIFRRRVELPLSASAVTGAIIALSCPASVPLWAVAAACAVSMILVKNLLNGKALLPLNPSATGLALLYTVIPAGMTAIPLFGSRVGFTGGEYVMASSTELGTLLAGKMPDTSIAAMLFGVRSGGIGHISAILIIGSFIYLLVRKAVRTDVLLGFLLTVGVYFYLNPDLLIVSDVLALKYALYQLLCADTLFTVVFIASSPVSCPKTSRGRLIAGVIGGLATALARVYVGGEISVVLAALVISLISRPLDLLFQPTGVFGGALKPAGKETKAAAENNES